MARSQKSSALLVLVFVFVTLTLVTTSHARLTRTKLYSSMRKKIDVRVILRELGYDDSRLEYYNHRRWLQGAEPDRVSPGGPDPQHH
ncbi:CLAVATA3/ESR (CLE)-related protein 5-like [Mercurialis annua]|uniref:CLAVATA3/ESR (CLE)-related protein 5-like n=1 Tax=Mercurialis annua TaxID=3986 RepID=UPI00216004A3|nr:CLAVATA3/ESR (CLE)-related protein 5-like [Mercurialis annua]